MRPACVMRHVSLHHALYMTKFNYFDCMLLSLRQILLGIILSWIICAIVTAAGGFTDDPKNPQYAARTDARLFVLNDAKWFRFPYPGT